MAMQEQVAKTMPPAHLNSHFTMLLVFFSRFRHERHGSVAAHSSGIALLGRPLEVQAELHQEQLPGLAQVPQEEDAG